MSSTAYQLEFVMDDLKSYHSPNCFADQTEAIESANRLNAKIDELHDLSNDPEADSEYRDLINVQRVFVRRLKIS